MTSDMDEAMEAEFDTVAEWTAQVAARPGPGVLHPGGLPGQRAARGAGLAAGRLRPRARGADDRRRGGRRRARRLRGRADRRPAGAGRARTRTPAARRSGCSACLVVQADATGAALPGRLRRRGLVAWACSAPPTARGPSSPCCGRCAGWRAPAGGSGCWSTWPTRPELDDPPEGNHFPTRGQLTRSVRPGVDLRPLDQAGAGDLPEPSARTWQDRTEAVERELRRRYGDTPQLTEANEQSDRIGHLLRSGQLTSQVMVARPK